MFPNRRLENATLLATWQALYQNLAFQSIDSDGEGEGERGRGG